MVELHPELRAEGWTAYHDETFLGHVGSIFVRPREGGRDFGILTGPQHRNLSGRLHGGVFMTLFDRSMGDALRNAQPGIAFATAQLSTDFIRPVMIGTFVELRTEIIRIGRTAVNMRAEAWAESKIVGAATALFLRAASKALDSA